MTAEWTFDGDPVYRLSFDCGASGKVSLPVSVVAMVPKAVSASDKM